MDGTQMFHKAPKIFANLVTLCSLEGAKSFVQNFRDLGEFPAQGKLKPLPPRGRDFSLRPHPGEGVLGLLASPRENLRAVSSLPVLRGPYPEGAPSGQSPPRTSEACAEYLQLWRSGPGIPQLSKLRKAKPTHANTPHPCTLAPSPGSPAQCRYGGKPSLPRWALMLMG